jgi:small subunit ribosomal protein S20
MYAHVKVLAMILEFMVCCQSVAASLTLFPSPRGRGRKGKKEKTMGKRAKSGVKRTRSTKKRRERNVETKLVIKKAFKAAEKALVQKASEAADLIKQAISAIDKAVERGIVHRNKAARKKSRLQLKLNKAK